MSSTAVLDPAGTGDVDDVDVFNWVDQGHDLYRRDPEYHTYYHTHRALNPRLPPPLARSRIGAVALEGVEGGGRDGGDADAVPSLVRGR